MKQNKNTENGSGVMTIYKNHEQKELPVYGLDRLGVYYKNTGNTYDQLTDHLGSVRAVIVKNGTKAAALVAAHDYYPFGMPMPGRTLTGSENYRYAYQGQEGASVKNSPADYFSEAAGLSREQKTGKEAFQLRLWDSRIGRWLTTNPAGQYHSPYLGMGNNPVGMIDPDGGYDKWWKAFKAWVGGGFQGKISKIDNPGTPLHKYSIKKWDAENNMWSIKLGDLSALENSGYYIDNGAYIKLSTGTISEWNPNMAYEWKTSNNVFKRGLYDFSNKIAITAQPMNPFQNNIYSLDGSTVVRGSRELQDAFVETTATFVPIGRGFTKTIQGAGTKGLLHVERFSASKFSRTFYTKGLSHSTRGKLNKLFNTLVIDKYNNKFSNGMILFKAGKLHNSNHNNGN